MEIVNVEIVVGRFCRIRPLTLEDGAALVDLRNRPEAAFFLTQWEPLTLEAHRRWYGQALERREILLAFEDAQGLAGSAALYHFDRARTSAEWGRLCHRQTGASALALMEGCYWLHRLAFELLGMERLYSGCLADNEPAVRLSERFGSRREGLRPRHHLTPLGYRDVVEFGVFGADFRAARADLERGLYGTRPLPIWTDPAREWVRSV